MWLDTHHTVDGRNPAPIGIWFIRFLSRCLINSVSWIVPLRHGCLSQLRDLGMIDMYNQGIPDASWINWLQRYKAVTNSKQIEETWRNHWTVKQKTCYDWAKMAIDINRTKNMLSPRCLDMGMVQNVISSAMGITHFAFDMINRLDAMWSLNCTYPVCCLPVSGCILPP